MSTLSPPLKRRALGRGLGALIPGGVSIEPEPGTTPPVAGSGASAATILGGRPLPVPPASAHKDYFLAPIEEIHPNPEQPRKVLAEDELEEMARSIREHGIVQPLLVRARKPAEGGGYLLVAGERRWRGAQRAGLREVPVIVREVTDAKAFELALVENVVRADLDPIEEAEAYRHLADVYGYTQDQIAERVGKDRATIANALRLLKLPQEVRAMVQAGRLSMGHARALLGLEDAELIARTARRVVARQLSVRATEELVRRERHGAPQRPEKQKSANVRDLEERLMRALGARVRVNDRGDGKGGKIEIDYANLDDLERLLDRLLAPTRH